MVISWDDFVSQHALNNNPVSLTMGVFDGVHLGHRKLIQKVLNRKDTISGVLTFNVNPRIVFGDHSFPGNIFTLEQKKEILHEVGVDTIIMIDFSYNFSRLSGKDFLKVLLNSCNLKYIALGENFKFGDKGETSSFDARSMLKNEPVEVDISSMAYYNNVIVSSTRIREAILAGKMIEAKSMLDRVFSLDIATVPQCLDEKTIIIDKQAIHQVLPPQGQYDVLLTGKENVPALCIIDNTHLKLHRRAETIYSRIIFNTDKL